MAKNSASAFALALFVAPSAASAEVLISEFVYDASGSDNKKEWIEILNGGPSSVDLARWKINDGSNHVLNAPPRNGSLGTTTLGPGAMLILADDAASFESIYGHDVSILDTSIDLPNTSGMISLVDSKGVTVDSVSYSKPLGAAGNGNSLQKTSAGKWVEAKPTPGRSNAEIASPVAASIPMPEPKKGTTSKSSKAATKIVEKAVDTADAEALETEPMHPVFDNDPETETASVASSRFASPWFFGMLGIVGVAAAAGFVAKRKKKDEWEIIEEID